MGWLVNLLYSILYHTHVSNMYVGLTIDDIYHPRKQKLIIYSINFNYFYLNLKSTT